MLRLVVALPMLLGLALGVYRPANSGWSSTYQTMRRSMALDNMNQITESLTYQTTTGLIILSNIIGNSNITGLSLASGVSGRAAVFSGATLPLQGSSGPQGTFGIVSDPTDDRLVWAGEGAFPATNVSACSVGQYDTVSKQRLQMYNFSALKNNVTYCTPNDIVITTREGVTEMYVSDFSGYRIYKADMETAKVSIFSEDLSLLCTASDPSGCTGGPLTIGPNGMALYIDAKDKQHLLVAVSPNRLVKFSLDTPHAGAIVSPGLSSAANALEFMDGITLYTPQDKGSRNSVLYVASGTEPTGALLVITSVDEWKTFELRQVLNFSCSDSSATAIRIAAEHLIGLCNNGFSPGRSLINTVPNFASSVPIAKTIQFMEDPNLVPESFGYDPNRNMLIMGSFRDGGIYGYPYNDLDSLVFEYDVADSYTYIKPSASPFANSTGFHVNPNNIFNDDCYALSCGTDSRGSPILALLNICSDEVVSTAVLPKSSTGNSYANDLITFEGKVYVTDFYGDQLWSVDIDAASHKLSNPMSVLTAANCATNKPSFCVRLPNGIVAIESRGYLVISMFDSGLAKYVPSTGAFTQVEDPTGLVYAFDGLALSSDGTIVYGVRGSLNRSIKYETVMAFYSCSDWNNVTLLTSFQTDCGGVNPTVDKLIPNLDGGEDLIILCNNGFGPGPYSFQRIRNVNSIVTNQVLQVTSCWDSGATGDSSTSFWEDLSTGEQAGFVIAIVVGSVAVLFVGVYLARNVFAKDSDRLLKSKDGMSAL